MFQLNKIRKHNCTKCAVFMAAVMLGGTWNVNLVSAQEPVEMQTAEFVYEDKESRISLCPENRYIIMYAGDGMAEIYDHQGNYIDNCRCYVDEYQVAATVGKDHVLSYSDGTRCTVYSMKLLETILDFAADSYMVVTSGPVCMVTEKKDGSFTVYDNEGNVLYTYDKPNWAEGNQGYARIIRMENGYLVGVCYYEEPSLLEGSGPVWISNDGTQVKEITAWNLQDAFASNSLEGFGENVVYTDWMNGIHEVYSLDGERLMKDINCFVYPYTSERNAFQIESFAELLIKGENGMITIYDTDLKEVISFAGNIQDYYPDYAGGFLTGVFYEELGGRICEGFVSYNGTQWVPYAKSEKGCVVYVNGELQEFVMKDTEWLGAFSDAYVAIGSSVDGNYVDNLYYRDTMELAVNSYWDDFHGIGFQLGKGGCLITETRYENEMYSTSLTIRNNQNEICFQSDETQSYFWQDDYLIMSRGIYKGITDYNGNWIIRTISDWEE